LHPRTAKSSIAKQKIRAGLEFIGAKIFSLQVCSWRSTAGTRSPEFRRHGVVLSSEGERISEKVREEVREEPPLLSNLELVNL
jgi:hypothetical protein